MQEGHHLLFYPWNAHFQDAQFRHPSQQRLQLVQDLCILGLQGLVFVSTLLGVSRQCISGFISFALTIVNPEVVPSKFLSLSDLPRAQTFRIHEVLEVFVVFKHKNFMLAAFEIVLLSFERFNDCQ